MAKIDKAGIYIDVQHLMRIVYKAQFEMDKKDRCVIYPTMMQLILDMLSHFCLSFCTENKLEHLDIMIAKFQAFKPQANKDNSYHNNIKYNFGRVTA